MHAQKSTPDLKIFSYRLIIILYRILFSIFCNERGGGIDIAAAPNISLIKTYKTYTKSDCQQIQYLCGFQQSGLDKKSVVGGQKIGSW